MVKKGAQPRGRRAEVVQGVEAQHEDEAPRPVKDEEGNPVLDKKGKQVYEIHSVPISADKKSQMNHLHMSANVQKYYGVLWNQADKCPLFRQEVPKVKNATACGCTAPTPAPTSRSPSGPTARSRATR